MLDFLKKALQIKWLWNVIAGSYLVAYAFWVPNLFSTNSGLMISVLALTLIVGFALLADGFLRASELENGTVMPDLPLKKLWRFAGFVLLAGYLFVYIPPEGRIVPHWFLDMITTVFAGFVMMIYGISDFLDLIKITFQTWWFWSIQGGFYLLVYAFWVPNLFSTHLYSMIFVFTITLIVGLGLLADGFFRACEINKYPVMPELPFRRLRRFAGATLLAGYLLIYLPPYGQIMAVAHWPFDLAISVISGLAMLVYGIYDH